MCGICGFNWKDAELIKKMTDLISHRGPDREGFFLGDNVSLGSRRLKIIDLSAQADQPIYNEDKSICVVYNGEIYNFPELRAELKSKGHLFSSRTDTEVIVHSYEEYGVNCLSKFDGMFAFALWDNSKKELFLARDRIGIKPLYYYYDGKNIIFGSEIKSILESPIVKREVNLQAVYYYLGYEFVPGPMTMFNNIYKLQPGHYLIYKSGEIKVSRYWDLEFHTENKDKEYYIEGIRKLADESVKRRLISDVPLGVFLSGGLDSSTVVALMRRHITGRLKTFSIGYKDKTYSELEYAEFVSRYFDTEHNVLMIDSIDSSDIEKALWHLDEPMTDLSAIPFYMICKKAKEDVTVALSGEGGDEVFVGYDRFKASKFYNLYYKMLPALFRRDVIGAVARKLPDQVQKKGLVNITKRFVEGANLPEEGMHMRWQYFSSPIQDRLLYLNRFRAKVNMDGFLPIRNAMANCNSVNRLNREVYLDTRFTMPDSVLMKVDRMSMANSLEVRVPFLDHKLIEFSAGIPSGLKLNGFKTKFIFREAIRTYLPKRIVDRGKQGYSFPSKNWLRNELKDYMVSLLNESALIRDNLNVHYVNILITQHLARTHNHNHILWALINMAVWHNKFIE